MRNYYFFGLIIFSLITSVRGIAQNESIDSSSENLNPINQIFERGEEFPSPYCSIFFIDGVDPITRVFIGDIDNTSDPTINGSPELENFTNLGTDVYTGNRYEIRVEGNTDGDFLHSVFAFVDWNQNGIFEENELHYLGFLQDTNGVDGQQAYNTILVPEDAPEGITRMRIVKRWHDGLFSPCDEGNLGQAEDYTLNIINSTGQCSVNYSGSFSNGVGNLQEVIYADDFEIAPNTKMEINQISLHIYSNINDADVMIYKDNNGTPGRVLHSFNRLEPASQTFISTQSGNNIYQTVFDLPDTITTLGNESGNRYWIGIKTYEGSEGSTNLWEVADMNTNARSHFSSDGINWTENPTGFDLAFSVSGNCEANFSYDGCTQEFNKDGGIALSIGFEDPNDYHVANDFIVEPGTKLTLNQLKVWISTDGEPTTFEISFFEDLNVGVGNQIGDTYDDLFIDYYPDGVVGWSTRWAVNLIFPEPIVFENDSEENIHYWIGISGENSTNDEQLNWGSFIYDNNSTHPTWRSLDGGETWIEYENRRNGNKAEGMMVVYAHCDNLLNTTQHEKNHFSFYPNPVTDILNISSDKEISSVSVFNLQGQLIFNRKNYSKQINLAHLKAGIYISKIVFNDGTIHTLKLIKD